MTFYNDIIFLDTEVLEHDWLAGFKFRESGRKIFFHNDRQGLIDFINENRKDKLFIGYNIRNYDAWILNGIYHGFNPKTINDNIILNKIKGYQMFDKRYQIPLFYYDAVPALFPKLKTLEAHAGVNIHESPIDFNIKRKLTREEVKSFIKYNESDLDNLELVFETNINDFNAQELLIKEYNLPPTAYGKTKVQLTAGILQAKRINPSGSEFDITLPKNLKIDKYQHVVDWFMSEKSKPIWNFKKKKYDFPKYSVQIGKIKHNFAWGGLHSKECSYYWKMRKSDELQILTGCGNMEAPVINGDVRSYYPKLAIEYDLLSGAVDEYGKWLYRKIFDTRIDLKSKGDPRAEALKIPLNGSYGASISKQSALYDALSGRSICVYGQLFLLDWIEKIEEIAEIVNSNTDGEAAKPLSIDYIKDYYEIANEWQARTKMELEFENLHEVYQKDVNNYFWVKENGKVKAKGFYLDPTPLKADLKIVAVGVKNYVLNGISAEETVNSCHDLRLFQKIVDVGKYDFLADSVSGYHFPNKVLRAFATNDNVYASIRKGKNGFKTLEKIPYVPPKSKVLNDNINGLPIPHWLDKDYYVSEIKKSIRVIQEPKIQKTFENWNI